jgi:hypothetical protein
LHTHTWAYFHVFSSEREEIEEMTAKCTSLCYDPYVQEQQRVKSNGRVKSLLTFISWMHSWPEMTSFTSYVETWLMLMLMLICCEKKTLFDG